MKNFFIIYKNCQCLGTDIFCAYVRIKVKQCILQTWYYIWFINRFISTSVTFKSCYITQAHKTTKRNIDLLKRLILTSIGCQHTRINTHVSTFLSLYTRITPLWCFSASVNTNFDSSIKPVLPTYGCRIRIFPQWVPVNKFMLIISFFG